MPDPNGPPNKWSSYTTIDGWEADAVLDLLNTQADKGNTTVLFAMTANGNVLFFGNYKK